MKSHGFSAIEAVISSVIFGVVVVMSFGAMSHSTKSFDSSIRQAYLTDKAEKALRLMQEELSDATQVGVEPVTITIGGASETIRNGLIYFQVPTRYRNTTDNKQGYSVKIAPVVIGYGPDPTFPDDVDFSLRYGWRDPFRMVQNEEDGGKMVYLQGDGYGLKIDTKNPDIPAEVIGTNGRTVAGFNGYRFQHDPNMNMGKYGQNGIISEAEEDVDLDGDGQKTRKFAIGFIERFYCVNMGSDGKPDLTKAIVPVTGSVQRIGESNIVQPIGSTVTVTEQSAKELRSTVLFYADPNISSRVDICIWMIQLDELGEPHIVRAQVTDFMRNNTKNVLSTSATSTQ